MSDSRRPQSRVGTRPGRPGEETSNPSQSNSSYQADSSIPHVSAPDPRHRDAEVMFRDMSQDFVQAQQSVNRTVNVLRSKMRVMHERLGRSLNALEVHGAGASLVELPGVHEDGVAVERISRQLQDQLESMERAYDTIRAVTRRERV